MGVQGLWQLLEPAGHPVDVHTLKGKILAVDASIWLHQLVKGFRDKDGNPLPNAHLLGVFYRVCKLLSYGIKPIFVFDGGVPILKRQTLAGRRKHKLEAIDKSEIARQKLLSNYIRQQLHRGTRPIVPNQQSDSQIASSSASSSSPKKPSSATSSPTKRDKFQDVDLELQKFREKFASSTEMDVDRVDKTCFKVDTVDDDEDDDSDEERSRRYGMDYAENFSAITSKDFNVLPLETQHEILFEMQESRKMNSWGKMEQMPNNLQDFSSYQMDRLVKRRFLQKKIQSVQQEMGKRHIHVQNLDELLKMNYNFDNDDVVGSKEKGFVLVKKSPHKKIQNKEVVDSEESSPITVDEDSNSMKTLIDNVDTDIETSDFNKTIPKPRDKIVNLASGSKNSPSNSNQFVSDLDEEEQIALAIKLSLEQSTTDPIIDPVFPTKEINIKEQDIMKRSDELKVQSGSIASKHTSPQPKPLVILPAASSSCSKFLDVVGFSSRAVSSGTTPTKKIPESFSESDESDDDFEDVQEEVSENNKERATVNNLLNNSQFHNNNSGSSTFAIATINIADVVSASPESDGDDMFADIFENDDNIEVTPKKDVERQEPESRVEEAINWDSDPDTECIEELEKRTPIKTVQESGNQEINRTLGRMPQQSKLTEVRMITTEYMQAQEGLNAERTKLQSEKGFQERVATSISDQISVETQELLGLFGIPYIISPHEAESQCAFLDVACLTDGTITDDSDAWLFGSLRVYKNFYGHKSMEFYQLADITQNLNLDREKLVLIAMLSGGDYSDGIEGVGPVTALEILAEFPTHEISAFDTLVKFREWWDMINVPDISIPTDMPKIREKLKKLKLQPGFPSEAVYQAYMNPSIDTSTETFRWGNPDLDAIKTYASNKFGWDQAKCDSMLLPVSKNLKCQMDKFKQPTLDSFLLPNRHDLNQPLKRKRGSKRLDNAFKKLKQNSTPVDEVALSSESSSEEDVLEEQESHPLPPPTKKVPPPPRSKAKRNNNYKKDEQPAASPSVEKINVNLHRNKTVNIPQVVQSATDQFRAKQKAIEIFKSKNTKK